MKRFLLPSLCAVLLVACDSGERIAKANDAVGASSGTSPANPNDPPPSDPPPSRIPVRTKPAPELPAPVAEVVQLAQTTLGESVLIHFIEAIREPFTLNADQVIYLNDIGFGTPVLNALLTKAASSPVAAVVPPGADPGVVTTPTAPGNVILPNSPGSTANGIGFPGGPSAGVGAPVYSAPQPGQVEPPVVVAPSEPVTYDTFYSGLSSYGNWVQDDSYGWCWQPTVVAVNPTWQPYSDGGRWLWSDYGWYWHSSYSWGWAPFHYGRWHQAASLGWVWSPGCDWAPAWVAWRQSDAYCGWAPLPPECHWGAGVGFSWYGAHGGVSIGFGLHDDSWYACSWDRFSAWDLPSHRLSHHELQPFVHNSKQIIAGDKSVNIIGNNNTVVINNGVSKDQVQRHTREEIRKVALKDASTPDAAAQRVPTGSNASRPEVATFRPRLAPATAQPVAPPADTAALCDLIVKLSHFAAEHADRITEIDLNPVIVHAEGRGLTVADALIVQRSKP